MHCSLRWLLRRGLEFHVCAINKSAHTKKVWKLIEITTYLFLNQILSNTNDSDLQSKREIRENRIIFWEEEWEVIWMKLSKQFVEYLTMVNMFSIFHLEMEIYCQDRLKKITSIHQFNFIAYRIIYFWNKLPNQIKNGNSVENFKIKFDDFWKKGKKKNLWGYFWKPSDEILNIIWSVYTSCMNSRYVLWKEYFLRLMWEDSLKQTGKWLYLTH